MVVDLPAIDNLLGDGPVAHGLVRLLFAGLFGAAIGLERELKTKPAGLKTNIFICVGSALFTIMSQLLTISGGDPSRVASIVVQGVGFLGAGAVLHSRGNIQGLTTAAGIWVVAAVGVTTGGGQYTLAAFCTFMLLFTLVVLSYIERNLNLKDMALTYELKGVNADAMLETLSAAMDKIRHPLKSYEVCKLGSLQRIIFTIQAKRKTHERLLADLKQQPQFTSVLDFPPESE